QHLALEVADMETLHRMQAKLEENGIEVDGPKLGSSTLYSIYFFDPSGNRLELAVNRELDVEGSARHAAEELLRWNSHKNALAVSS
ncbi:MAG: VOC family protein, partial [Betaproteobacteria bacterium]|nr:VOC family protein [Betaproteobacteria bacterium]